MKPPLIYVFIVVLTEGYLSLLQIRILANKDQWRQHAPIKNPELSESVDIVLSNLLVLALSGIFCSNSDETELDHA
jgi:hypothetical protein